MALIWLIVLLFFGNWLFTDSLVTFPLNFYQGFQTIMLMVLGLLGLGVLAWIFGEGKD